MTDCPEGFTLAELDKKRVPAVAELEKICFSEPWSEKSLEYLIGSGHTFAAVCESADGRLAGYISADCLFDEAAVLNLAVHPDFRRRGIAQALTDRLIEHAREAGIKRITLEVRPSNEAALSLYGKLGFSEYGRIPRHYRLPSEDALIMNLYL